jgi:hypothetical protein
VFARMDLSLVESWEEDGDLICTENDRDVDDDMASAERR